MSEPITDQSKAYFEKFLVFCNSIRLSPIIVGGWAVWAHTQFEYSVDVDFVLRSEAELVKLRPFFDQEDFKRETNGGISFVKKISDEGLGSYLLKHMIFDVALFSDKNTLSENKNIDVPWSLLENNTESKTIEGISIEIPSRELLIVFKVKAIIDRSHKLAELRSISGSLRPSKKTMLRYEFKIDKDRRDVQNLIKAGPIDQLKIDEILAKTKFKPLFDEAIKREFSNR